MCGAHPIVVHYSRQRPIDALDGNEDHYVERNLIVSHESGCDVVESGPVCLRWD